MKTSKYIIFISMFFLCISCKETVTESLLISIQNKTEDTIHIRLFPKGDIGGLYPICFGCSGHKQTEFTSRPLRNTYYNWADVIFTTDDLRIKPYILASRAFDSIRISLKDTVILKFTHDGVTGYSENIFSENSTWYFEIVEDERPTFLYRNPVRYYSYTFVILEDKVIIDNNLLTD